MITLGESRYPANTEKRGWPRKKSVCRANALSVLFRVPKCFCIGFEDSMPDEQEDRGLSTEGALIGQRADFILRHPQKLGEHIVVVLA